MFRFIKKVFFVGLTILLSFTRVNSLSCISMNSQACNTRPEIVNVNSNDLLFYPLVLKEVNLVAIVIILVIRMQKFAFLML